MMESAFRMIPQPPDSIEAVGRFSVRYVTDYDADILPIVREIWPIGNVEASTAKMWPYLIDVMHRFFFGYHLLAHIVLLLAAWPLLGVGLFQGSTAMINQILYKVNIIGSYLDDLLDKSV